MTKESRLEAIHRRATRYEVVAFGEGIARFLVGYTRNKSRDGLLTTMQSRGEDLIGRLQIGEKEQVRFETRPIIAAVFGGNRARAQFSGRTEREAIIAGELALPGVCRDCGRRYDKMPYRERMLNGHMGHLEMDPVTGATVLMDEGR